MAIQNNILLKQKTNAPNISNITTNRVSTSQHEVKFELQWLQSQCFTTNDCYGVIDHRLKSDSYFKYNL